MTDVLVGQLHRTILIVAALNLAYFGIEFTVALNIGSVSLFADSVDFLEDTAVNILILIGLRWSTRGKTRLAMLLAALMLVPNVATVWTAWQQWQTSHVPTPMPLTLTGLGALTVNLCCTWLLAKVRHAQGSLTRAAFLSARNDTAANLAIIIAGGVTAVTYSPWPDLLAGCGILLMNLDAAREVMAAAITERNAADRATS